MQGLLTRFFISFGRRSALLIMLLLPLLGWGQVTITSSTLNYNQNFNTLPSTGTSPFSNNSTILGVYAQRTGSGTSIVADAGTSTGGSLYSYGSAAADRALGSVGSGNVAAGSFAHGILFQNTTGGSITSLAVNYTGEQWRNGGNTTPNLVTFSYQTSATAITMLTPIGASAGAPIADAGWTDVSALNFTSPINTSTGGSLDGNQAANRVVVASTVIDLSATPLANNSYIMLRWKDIDHAGTDHGLAIDDVSVVFTPAPAGVPTITSIAPTSAAAGGAAFTLTVNGASFTGASVISFAGTALTTDATNAATGVLTATVPAARIAAPGNYAVTVTDGAATSNSVNFPVTATYYSTAASDLSNPANFGVNTDGSGASPASLTLVNTTYFVSGAGHTFGTAVTLGTGSKLVLQTGSDVTIGSAANFTGLVNVAAGATLVQQNATPAVTFGTVAATSTVEYSQSGTYTLVAADIPSTGFGNLTMRNSTKALPGVTIAIAGNLLVDNVSGFSGGTSPFTTLNLGGNLTLTGTTTFEVPGNGRITVNATNLTTPQLISGNGNTVRLFRLTLPTGQAGVSLVDANGGTPLEVGNASSGGYQLATGTTLNINNNTLSFFPLGKAAITGTIGQLAFSSGASLLFSRNNTTTLGTLTLTPGSTQLTNLTLDVQGATAPGNTLTLPNNLTVSGTLSLQNGILASTTGNLTLNGPLSTATTGVLVVSPTTNLTVGGSGNLGILYISGTSIGTLGVNRTGEILRLGSSLKVVNALTLTAGTLAIQPTTTLEIAGALTAAGTASPIQGSATSNLTFSGSGAVSGSLSLIPVGGDALNVLTLNRTTFGLIPLANTVRVATLSLIKGALQTGPADRVVATVLDPANPGNANSFVNALTLTTVSATNVTLTYPLGAALGGYRPLTLNATQGAATTAYTARDTEGDTNVRGYNGLIKRVSRRRYFTVTEEVTSNFISAILTLSFGSDDGVSDFASLRIGRSTGGAYDDVNVGSTPTTTGTLADGTITDAITAPALGDFAIATTSDLPVNPLPVELMAFSAQRQADKSVSLKWATASERKSARFEVQRSLDGREYALVASVAAHGNSSQARVYATLDKAAPAGRLYYRLRQVDLNGTSAFSPVVLVVGAGEAAKVQLYPNPAYTTLRFISEIAQAYRVLNQLGQPLLQGTTEAGTARIGIEALPPGLYFLELQTATGRTVQKFEKN